jgi:hypothetical protein
MSGQWPCSTLLCEPRNFGRCQAERPVPTRSRRSTADLRDLCHLLQPQGNRLLDGLAFLPVNMSLPRRTRLLIGARAWGVILGDLPYEKEGEVKPFLWLVPHERKVRYGLIHLIREDLDSDNVWRIFGEIKSLQHLQITPFTIDIQIADPVDLTRRRRENNIESRGRYNHIIDRLLRPSEASRIGLCGKSVR